MSGASETAVLAALDAVVRDHGWLVVNNPARLRATLSDVLGPDFDLHRDLVDAFVVSADEGVPTEVRAAGRAGLAEVGPALAARLGDWGIAEERALWVVAAWGCLLPEPTRDPADRPVVAPTQVPPVEGRTDPEPATEPTASRRAGWPAFGPTMRPPVPAPTPDVPAAGRPAGVRKRRGLIIGLAAAVLLAFVGVAVAVSLTGEDRDKEPIDETLPPASDSALIRTSSARVASIKPVVMGGYLTGVALVGLSPQSTVTNAARDEFTAPEGGSLVGFRLTQGDCESAEPTPSKFGPPFKCRPWQEANLGVEVDGDRRRMPVVSLADDIATFVVAVPAGAESVDLVMTSDNGRRQSVSLLTGEPSADNIAVFSRGKRHWWRDERFQTIERVSIDINYGDGVGRRSVTRMGEVESYSLGYWATDKVTASAPDRAILTVYTGFTWSADPGDRYQWWRSDEVRFRDAQNRLYRPIPIPRDKTSPWHASHYYFDVPASITSGRLLFGGGTSSVLSRDGVTRYTKTTQVTPVALRLAG